MDLVARRAWGAPVAKERVLDTGTPLHARKITLTTSKGFTQKAETTEAPPAAIDRCHKVSLGCSEAAIQS